MPSKASVELIRLAKSGDRAALGELCRRHYPQWAARFHRKLGNGLRGFQDTADLIQSAMLDVLRDIPSLEHEASFFAWVSSIIRRKIFHKRRRLGRYSLLPLEAAEEPGEPDDGPERRLVTLEEHNRILDAILELFPTYPENMALVYLRLFEERDIPSLMTLYARSNRTVHRFLEQGMKILRSRLERN